MRGLSSIRPTATPAPSGVPACAGVIARRRKGPVIDLGRPRACGGYRLSCSASVSWNRSSPRPRGLSAKEDAAWVMPLVVPAHAGVIVPPVRATRSPTRLPRARGGYRRSSRPCPSSSAGPRICGGYRTTRVITTSCHRSSLHTRGLSVQGHSLSGSPKSRPRARGVYHTRGLPAGYR